MGKTSTQVKQRYLDKAYSQIAVRLQKDLVAQWEDDSKPTVSARLSLSAEQSHNIWTVNKLPINNIREVITHGNKRH